MFSDRLVVGIDRAIRTLFANARTVRPMPGGGCPEADLSESERRLVVGLMRVNHCGEVCAQALYQGQALTSKDAVVSAALYEAAEEETEHLAWTERRMVQLGGHKSMLNPVWYAGAFSIGVLAGRLGSKWNLGFLAETERQVEVHLAGHLAQIPPQDQRSREVLGQMIRDEAKHANTASRLGGASLPPFVKMAMRLASKVMTRTSYFI